jgi:hypothetical protein
LSSSTRAVGSSSSSSQPSPGWRQEEEAVACVAGLLLW